MAGLCAVGLLVHDIRAYMAHVLLPILILTAAAIEGYILWRDGFFSELRRLKALLAGPETVSNIAWVTQPRFWRAWRKPPKPPGDAENQPGA
jgi:hypothetical protein